MRRLGGSPQGITVLARANPTGDGEHTWLLHLNLDGVVIWERHYDPKYGAGRAITRLARGGFAIAGEVQRAAMAYQGSLLQVDATGEVVAATSLGPRGVTGFNTLQSRADGTIVAGGSSAWKAWLVTVDPTLRNPAERALAVEEIKELQVLPSGDLAVLENLEKSTSGFGRAQLTAIARDGQIRWQRRLPTSGRRDPAALVLRRDRVLVMGTGAPAERDPSSVWMASVDAEGNVAWERTLAATARGRAAAAMSDGYAVAGETATAGGERSPHGWRLGDDGAPRWEQSYHSPSSGDAVEMVNGLEATADDGLVLVSSTTHGAARPTSGSSASPQTARSSGSAFSAPQQSRVTEAAVRPEAFLSGGSKSQAASAARNAIEQRGTPRGRVGLGGHLPGYAIGG